MAVEQSNSYFEDIRKEVVFFTSLLLHAFYKKSILFDLPECHNQKNVKHNFMYESPYCLENNCKYRSININCF